jgi:hypothetical protein
MTTHKLPLLAALLLAPLGSGCADTSSCEAFAEHLAEIAAKENPNNQLSADNRAKLIKNTTETCVSKKIDNNDLECALKAETSAAMKACEQPKADG